MTYRQRLEALGFTMENPDSRGSARFEHPAVTVGSFYVYLRHPKHVSCTGKKSFCRILKGVPGAYPGSMHGKYPNWKGVYADAVIEKLEETYA